MLKIVFENGHTRQYNGAHFLSGRDLYDKAEKTKWFASILDNGVVIEAKQADEIVKPGMSVDELINALLHDFKIETASNHKLALLKKKLFSFDSKKKQWKWKEGNHA